ncbi:hypothetical protein [Streptomyces sp. SID13726]|uniref:hypothetical protein n=1 Tax=Streptomyces sp. SID13726 TaxID=2706058 RepID=UPI0013B7BCD5|nr:hypothetical protein [Streptomyces sp. SID13726]NEB03985.1 hypothetical protein [Streptomyces sp. SID13726]
MSIPLRRYADDHVRTVVALTSALRLPELASGGSGSGGSGSGGFTSGGFTSGGFVSGGFVSAGEGHPGSGRPGVAGRPSLRRSPTAPERQERTP